MRAHDGDMFDDETHTRKDDTMTDITTIVQSFLDYLDSIDSSESMDTGVINDYADLMREYLSDNAGSDPLPINVITNAPAAYDYESTVLRTVNVKGHTSFSDMNRSSPFRLVALDSREDGYYAEYQQNRYKSGGYLVLKPDLWDQWIKNGIIIIPEEKGDDDAASS